jgi:hypothetical protein
MHSVSLSGLKTPLFRGVIIKRLLIYLAASVFLLCRPDLASNPVFPTT